MVGDEDDILAHRRLVKQVRVGGKACLQRGKDIHVPFERMGEWARPAVDDMRMLAGIRHRGMPLDAIVGQCM